MKGHTSAVMSEHKGVKATVKKEGENLISCPAHTLPKILNLFYENKEESGIKRVLKLDITKTHCFIFR